MGRNTRKRRTPPATRIVAGAAALAVGGGGLIWANFYASAHEEDSGRNRARSAAAQIATIDCPDVGQRIRDVPDRARGEVDGELASMDSQITDAYQRLATTRRAQAGDALFVRNSILGPLKDRRKALIDRIQLEINRAGGRADDTLDELAGCQGRPADQQQDGGGQNGDGGHNGDGQDQDDNGNGVAGPVADDFIDINDVRPNSRDSRNGLAADGDGGSTGTFTTDCGVNENNLFNSDNLIAAPGVDNGAHHTHDYVGNQDNDAFSSDEDLATADTSCRNQGDRSTYYWPVLRLQDGTREFDANDQGGGAEGNIGRILKPARAELRFVGSRRGDVVAMPKFLRVITGDAKSFTNGDANANTSWSCSGFEDRQVTDKYPLCPEGSQVLRTTNFQSCWDGRNIDSANHRDHMAFVQEDGGCPNGFQAVPQLQVRLTYDIPTPTVENGQVRNPYAVDSFPEQLHKPITDHNDFVNVMDEDLMNEVVDCVNRGEDCQ
ncbi:DUF1996 domain-containing protein [Streptomyces violaceorubidus]|uniref:DUF1996 domain-containing protein n=1 Tax=Streptomyces violaceorubidus TaxID=284042 RepID=UPI0004BFCDEA|nr:DUF1996 domain-containing protein [Streptomyces violaceorubidus]